MPIEQFERDCAAFVALFAEGLLQPRLVRPAAAPNPRPRGPRPPGGHEILLSCFVSAAMPRPGPGLVARTSSVCRHEEERPGAAREGVRARCPPKHTGPFSWPTGAGIVITSRKPTYQALRLEEAVPIRVPRRRAADLPWPKRSCAPAGDWRKLASASNGRLPPSAFGAGDRHDRRHGHGGLARRPESSSHAGCASRWAAGLLDLLPKRRTNGRRAAPATRITIAVHASPATTRERRRPPHRSASLGADYSPRSSLRPLNSRFFSAAASSFAGRSFPARLEVMLEAFRDYVVLGERAPCRVAPPKAATDRFPRSSTIDVIEADARLRLFEARLRP